MKNWRADPDAFSVIFRSVFQVKKMGNNGRLIGVLIQMVFGSFSDLGIGLKKWMKMGGILGCLSGWFLGHFLIGVSDPKNR